MTRDEFFEHINIKSYNPFIIQDSGLQKFVLVRSNIEGKQDRINTIDHRKRLGKVASYNSDHIELFQYNEFGIRTTMKIYYNQIIKP